MRIRTHVNLLICCLFLFSSIHASRMVGEWEPAWGTLIRWPLGIPISLVLELTQDDTLYVLYETAGEMQNATNSFQSWGVSLAKVQFIQTTTFSMWTRDWGPQCVFTDEGELAVADPVFDGYPWVPGCMSLAEGAQSLNQILQGNSQRQLQRDYSDDDAIPADVADYFNWPLVPVPAYVTGGNIMTDGEHRAFSTQQMLAENAELAPEPQFLYHVEETMGLEDYHFLDNPEVYGIQHIDCYAKLLSPGTVLVKEVDSDHPEYHCCEELAVYFQQVPSAWNRPFDVQRIYCGRYNGNDVAAYTNSLILNDKVYVPLFDITADEEALATYTELMPGYEVIGFHFGTWYYYDALHCRTMGIFDPGMLRLTHPHLDRIEMGGQDFILPVTIKAHSNADLIEDSLQVHWRLRHFDQWEILPIQASAGIDSFTVDFPDFPLGTTFEYYLTAADNSGRTEHDPPAGFITVNVGDMCYDSVMMDVSGDGLFNILDVIQVLNIILGQAEPDVCVLWTADPNLDSEINILDILSIVQWILQP